MTHYIFDLDGTLLNTLRAHYETLYLLCLMKSKKKISISDIALCNLPDLRKTLDAISEQFDLSINVGEYQTEFLKHISKVSLNITAKELAILKSIDKSNLILFTGRDMCTTQLLLNRFLPDIFLKVISSDQCEKPLVPTELKKMTDLKIYIGDCRSDLEISQKLPATFFNINKEVQRTELFAKLQQEQYL